MLRYVAHETFTSIQTLEFHHQIDPCKFASNVMLKYVCDRKQQPCAIRYCSIFLFCSFLFLCWRLMWLLKVEWGTRCYALAYWQTRKKRQNSFKTRRRKRRSRENWKYSTLKYQETNTFVVQFVSNLLK